MFMYINICINTHIYICTNIYAYNIYIHILNLLDEDHVGPVMSLLSSVLLFMAAGMLVAGRDSTLITVHRSNSPLCRYASLFQPQKYSSSTSMGHPKLVSIKHVLTS